MARSITTIQQQIITAIQADSELLQATSTSKTAIWRLWSYVVAAAVWTIEVLFDDHTDEINAMLLAMKPHGLKWYYQKALAYQHGHELAENNEADYYDNTNRTDEEVEEAKIIINTAVNETSDGFVRVKIRGADGPVTPEQEAGFTNYMNIIKDAGVYLEIINRNPDSLRLSVRIYYNPLVLDSEGKYLSGGDSEPVRDAIENYISTQIGFNGELVLMKLIDELQVTDGVVIAEVTSSEYKNDAGEWQPLISKQIPFAGYFSTAETEVDELTVENDDGIKTTIKGYLNITYYPNE